MVLAVECMLGLPGPASLKLGGRKPEKKMNSCFLCVIR